MKILMITDVYFPRVNGVSTSIMTFRKYLMEYGHEVTLIAPSYGADDSVEPGIIRVLSRVLPVDKEDRMMKFEAIMALEKQLKKHEFDIVHIQTPFVAHYAGVKLSRRLGIPRVESYHTFFEEYLYHYIKFVPKAWLKFVARRFSKSQCNNVHGLIIPSTAMRDVLVEYGITAHSAIIPTGLDLPLFENGDGASFRQKHQISNERPVMVHVGRVAHEKNIDFLLHTLMRVCRTIPNVLLIIAGEGPAVSHLKQLVDELTLTNNVLFIGYLDRKTELLDCYRAGDVFVFASNTETQGLVLLEAMACGTLVVSTAVMGTKDILRDETGCLIAEEDEEDFANKVVELLSDHTLRDGLRKEAKQYSRSWSNDRMNIRLIDFYEHIAGHKIDSEDYMLDCDQSAVVDKLV